MEKDREKKTDRHTFVVCAYKQSEYLETCVRSVLRQTIQSKVVMCTSTPNHHIETIAKKYRLKLYIREGESNIRDDWNFAISCADTPLVTIAHQDDIYHSRYVESMLDAFNARPDATIFFSGYRPVKNGIVSLDANCIIRAMLRAPMCVDGLAGIRFFKRLIFSLGNSVCCPTVTYAVDRVGKPVFTSSYKYNIDWDTFRKLAQLPGSFAYDPHALVGYRVHAGATSKQYIDNSGRFEEDKRMFTEIWGKTTAQMIMKFYTRAYDTYKD